MYFKDARGMRHVKEIRSFIVEAHTHDIYKMTHHVLSRLLFICEQHITIKQSESQSWRLLTFMFFKQILNKFSTTSVPPRPQIRYQSYNYAERLPSTQACDYSCFALVILNR